MLFLNQLTTDLIRQLKTFSKKEGENIVQVWELFKELLLLCPHHGLKKWHTINFFYDRLAPKTKKLVETTCHGEFIDKNEEESEAHFEWLVEHALE